jgi:drug/metabolite transporter (DMT)-like permease
MQIPRRRWLDSLLAWYLVSVWGSGFIATKVGLQYAPPRTFLTPRYVFGLACPNPPAPVRRPALPPRMTTA